MRFEIRFHDQLIGGRLPVGGKQSRQILPRQTVPKDVPYFLPLQIVGRFPELCGRIETIDQIAKSSGVTDVGEKIVDGPVRINEDVVTRSSVR